MADELSTITPYSTAMPFIAPAALPAWLDEYEAQRIASYNLYWDLYSNSPLTYNALLRGSDEKPILIPTAKRIINTLSRYVGKGWGYTVDPVAGTPAERQAAIEAFDVLFKRERILSVFSAGKKPFLAKGDWIWYVSADPDKAPGTRISLRTIDPMVYFPLTADDDPNKIVGQMMVEQFLAADGKEVIIKRQRWLKYTHPEHPNFEQIPGEIPFDIAYDSVTIKQDGWNDEEKQQILSTATPLELVPGISKLPMYHIKNNEENDNPYGVSDLSGLETIIAGVNQVVSDNDLALAMAGLGMYVTDSGAPIDEETGEAEDWILGPNRVVEIGDGKKFTRVNGVTNIEQANLHMETLKESAFGTNGITNIALGAQGANIQESGVALALRMSPLFDTADEKDLSINDVLSQLFWDLKQWFLAYEQIDLGDAIVRSTVTSGERLPFDRASRFQELTTMLAAGVVDIEYVQNQMVTEFNYTFPDGFLARVQAANAATVAAADPYAARVATELSGGTADGV